VDVFEDANAGLWLGEVIGEMEQSEADESIEIRKWVGQEIGEEARQPILCRNALRHLVVSC